MKSAPTPALEPADDPVAHGGRRRHQVRREEQRRDRGGDDQLELAIAQDAGAKVA